MKIYEEISDFDEDAKESERLEKLLCEDIQKKKYPTAHKYEPNNSDYDIFINEINEGIEFKNDKKGAIYPNICIEIGQSLWDSDGKTVPSGLLKTIAKYWVQYNQTYWYLAYTSRIKKMYDWYINIVKEYEDTINSSTLTGEALKNLEQKLMKKRMGMRIDYRTPKKQKGGSIKYMDLFIIPEKIYRKICLEIETLDDMTYKDLK